MSKLPKKQQLAKICNCCFLFSSKSAIIIKILEGIKMKKRKGLIIALIILVLLLTIVGIIGIFIVNKIQS